MFLEEAGAAGEGCAVSWKSWCKGSSCNTGEEFEIDEVVVEGDR